MFKPFLISLSYFPEFTIDSKKLPNISKPFRSINNTENISGKITTLNK